MPTSRSLEIGQLAPALASGELSARELLKEVYRRIEELGMRPIWIELVPFEQALSILAAAEARRAQGVELPLFGIPFAVKDNIDVAGVPTTAGCPAFSYVPERNAGAVQRLVDAGAVPVGKTNLDQFATGLVGTRSPYGVCASAFDERYISGGSSSGSALAVARGLVSFALGTDTAGSGRVPAAFNNLVGVKPTRGLVSARGVVPACAALDCVSVFAASVADAERVLEALRFFDEKDVFSRELPSHARTAAAVRRVGIPRGLEFFGNTEYERLFADAAARLAAFGVECVPVDVEPFLEAAGLLYAGPWIAERYAAVGEFIASHPNDVHPVVRDIILPGGAVSGADVFRGRYRLAALERRTASVWREVDALFFPTAGTHYTIEEVLRDALGLNLRLGRYTNFVNLLDLAAIAVPAGFTRDRLPFGVSFVGPAFSDARLSKLAERLHLSYEPTLGATGAPIGARAASRNPLSDAVERSVLLAVAGAHLTGLPLNHELTSRGGSLVRTQKTTPDYRFYALAGTVPPKPGLVRSPGFSGPGIEVELWSLSYEAFAAFVAAVPQPMVIGNVTLDDGSVVKGFSCEPYALEGSEEITRFGGFRAYLAARAR